MQPLVDLHFLPSEWAGVQDASSLIVTSRNALRALHAAGDYSNALAKPLYAVGPGTAHYAAKLGFKTIRTGPGNAAGLASFVAASESPQARLVYLCGVTLAFDMPAALARAGLNAKTLTVYHTKPRSRFDDAIIAAFEQNGLDGVILMSPLSARIFDALCVNHGLEKEAAALEFFCLSPKIASALIQLKPANLHVAAHPSLGSLIKVIEQPGKTYAFNQPS
jgi:uroporphyrinogen-III synthase